VIARSFVRETTESITAREVERTETRWLRAVAHTRAVSRDDEVKSANHGLAEAGA
jgi:hypothetical protein